MLSSSVCLDYLDNQYTPYTNHIQEILAILPFTLRSRSALGVPKLSLVQRGVATVEDVDTAIAYGPGVRWARLGPFLNLHASGGSGGITHVLRHLGTAQREWARDLGTYPETEDYIEPITRAVETKLQAHNFLEMIRQRDQLLIELLEAKRKLSQIP
jgi:hypothetical protein